MNPQQCSINGFVQFKSPNQPFLGEILANVPLCDKPPFARGNALSDTNPLLLNFACPKCQKKLRAPSNLAGQKLVCPKCSSPIRVPGVVEIKNDDDDWLSLNEPAGPINASSPQKIKGVKKTSTTQGTSPSKTISPPAAPQSPKTDSNDFLLAPPETIDSKRSPVQPPKQTSKESTTRKSIFDDDLPELAPFDDDPTPITPAKTKLSNSVVAKPSVKPTLKPTLALPDIPLPGLDLSDIPLAPLEATKPNLVGSLDDISLEGPALIGPMASLVDEEFNFHCKLCGSLLSSSRSRIGTMTSCPDCFSQVSVPSPPAKKKLADVKMDEEVARVTFAPIDSLSVRGTNSSSEKTKEILDRAEQTLEDERDEFLDGTFDTKRWMGFLFGFLRDPLIIAAAVGLGFITGFWLFAIAAVGTWIELQGSQLFIARLALLGVFCIPIVGAICMCGIAILTMAANRASRVVEWPFMRLSESIGECAMVMVSVLVSSIPGGMIGVVFHSLNAHPMVSLSFVLLGVWGLTPILLLCMIANSSILEPYSKAVINSIKSRPEAWGAMYMQTAMGMVAFFLFMLLTSAQSPVGDFILGFTVPLFCFFIINQYGVLAGRISQVTDMGFDGDFSED